MRISLRRVEKLPFARSCDFPSAERSVSVNFARSETGRQRSRFGDGGSVAPAVSARARCRGRDLEGLRPSSGPRSGPRRRVARAAAPVKCSRDGEAAAVGSDARPPSISMSMFSLAHRSRAHRSRAHRSRARRSPSSLACLALVAASSLAACKAKVGEPCGAPADCRDGLVCLEKQCLAAEAAADRCNTSDQCKSHGDCTPFEGTCQAHSDADCKRSAWCAEQGWCTFRERPIDNVRHCAAASAADCMQSEACKRSGRCTFNVKGDCAERPE